MNIYFDNNATTEVDPSIIEIWVDAQKKYWGNSSSVHKKGRDSKAKLKLSKTLLSKYFKVNEENIFFTSGGTDSLYKSIDIMLDSCNNIVTSKMEHPVILNKINSLDKKIDYIDTKNIETNQIEKLINRNTLIILSYANPEIGIINDIEKIAKIAEEKKAYFIVDGIAALGKYPIEIYKGVTCYCFSGHKIHSTKGSGLIIFNTSINKNLKKRLSQGTGNIPDFIAITKAIEILMKNEESIYKHLKTIRDYFEKSLKNKIPDITIVAEKEKRVFNVSSITFHNIEAEVLIMRLDIRGVMCSFGTACSSGSLTASQTLLNYKLTKSEALSTIRFSFSKFNTIEEVDLATDIIQEEYLSIKDNYYNF